LNLNGGGSGNNHFNNHHHHYRGYNKGNLPGGTETENGTIIDYKVEYDKMVDSIIIHYADWSYL
jgi:hypothetical protein